MTTQNRTAQDNRGDLPHLTLILSTALALVTAVPLTATAQNSDDTSVSVATDTDTTDDTQKRDEIVVTGSRIARDGFNAPQPVNVISADGIQLAGTPNLIEVLNEQPQISNGFFNTNTSFSFGNVGLNQLDLRDLGVRRTLTIVNGRRRGGTPDDSNFLAFDLNNIPTALVDRVEVITGGTSAVYGADAVVGVINVILKDDFEGLEISAQHNRSFDDGDYGSYFVNATMGSLFDEGRGSAVLSVGLSQNDRLRLLDRGLENDFRFLSNPADTGPDDGIPSQIPFNNVRFAFFGIPTITTVAPIGDGGNATPDGSENTVIFDPSLNRFRLFDGGRGLGSSIDGFASTGADGGDARLFNTLIAPLRRNNIYSRVKYDVTPKITANAEFIYADSFASDIIGPVFDVSSSTVTTDNAFIPSQTRQALLDAGETSFSLSRQHNEFGPRGADIERDFYAISLGLESKLFNDRIDWEFVYDYGQSNTENTNRNDRLDANWFNALDSIIDPMTGETVCRDVQAREEGCVPVNVFGEGTISAAAVDYISADHTTTTQTSQELFQLLISGEAFELPAGTVRYAAGLEHREDRIDFKPSFVWENALGFFASQFSPIDESNSVDEAFAEVLVPVVSEQPFVKDLTLEGAFRVSDYERAGTTESWKLGGSWTITDDIRLRATRARAVRAPTLGELFDPGSRGAFGITDPCDPLELGNGSASRAANCAALGLDSVNFDPDTRRVTTLVFTTGNPDLDVEEGDTLTVGAVITPRFLPNLQVAFDYFDIDLAEGISRIGPQQTADNCVDVDSINNQFCSFVTRDGTGNIREISDSYVNVAGLKIRGFDLQATYDFEVTDVLSLFGNEAQRDLGSVRLNFVGTKNIDNQFIDRDIITDEESLTENVGRSFLPEYRLITSANYSLGEFGARWQARYASETQTNVDTSKNGVWGQYRGEFYSRLSGQAS